MLSAAPNLTLTPTEAKRLTDKAINQMEGVQNLRKAVYE
jgi:hypothetical protein